MMKAHSDTPVEARVRELVEPIIADLRLELYDLELRGGTLRITLDAPAGQAGEGSASDEPPAVPARHRQQHGLSLDALSLASRLISKELDVHDPVPSRYTLEVTSPGVERALRTPDHFRRAIGSEVALRLSDVAADERRVRGELVDADADAVRVRVGGVERQVRYAEIDRARTVFEWGPQPKPGKQRPGGRSRNEMSKREKSA